MMVDLIERVKYGTGCDVTYAWFNTGLEYRATKRHLDYLEERYGIEILRCSAEKSIPAAVREYGQPFLSKYVSQQIERLQRHGFQFEDEPMDVLMERYPDDTSGIKWWSNGWSRTARPGWYDIGRNHLLREFMIENPPWFRVSDKCCTFAKKNVAKRLNDEMRIDLEIVGVRKAEGGIRTTTQTCFTKGQGTDKYRPLFWFSDKDKATYCQLFDIHHSDCYGVWGFRRTGCVGCPFNRGVFADLETARGYEPQLVHAVERVFKDAYEYTRMYNDYKTSHKSQMRLEF